MYVSGRELDGEELMAARRVALAVAFAVAILPAGASARPSQAAQSDEQLVTADGYRVGVLFSPAYPADDARRQELTTELNGLPHGAEMGLLHITLVRPADIEAVCGAEAAACYAADRIYLPGEQPPGSPPVAFLLAHEYGHHVLAHRRNDPWNAGDWGPKRWASALDVCRKVHRHELLIGYTSIPGEAFAETYAMMLFPQLHLAWGYTDLLAADEHVEAAAREDVLKPWTGPTTRTRHVRIGRRRVRSLPEQLPLDGRARFTVAGPGRVTVDLLSRGHVLTTAHPRHGRTRLTFTVCGQRQVKLRLRATRSGSYELTTMHP
jgi:hypothetical protein